MTLLINLLPYIPGHSGFSSYVRRVVPGIPGTRLILGSDDKGSCRQDDSLPKKAPVSRRMAILQRLSLAQHGLDVELILRSSGRETAKIEAVYSPYSDYLFQLPDTAQIITCHDLTPLYCANSLKAKLRYRFWTPVHLHRATKVIAISRFVADQLLEIGVPASKIEVIWNGVAINRPPVTAPTSDDLVVLARHDANKNVAFIIQFYQKLISGYPTWSGRLLIIGRPGRETTRLKRMCAKYPAGGKIQFIEAVEEGTLVKILRNSLALISASLMEGFDYPVLEAKAEGIPTLVSKIPCHKEIHAGSSLFFDPINEPGELVRCVVELSRSRDLWNQLSSKGHQLAASLSIERQRQEIQALLQQHLP